MPRRTFLLRHVKHVPPDDATLGRYLFLWDTGDLYNRPENYPLITSPVLFGNDKPLALEVGCGTGEFLCHLAAHNPDHNFVGLDISLKSLYHAIHQAVDLGLDNIRFIKASVPYIYPLLDDNSLQAVYVHFPEPILHPKFRKRRFFNAEFFEQMARALVPGGLLSFVTDSPELLKIVLPHIDTQPALHRTHPEPYLIGFNPPVKSRYQQYWETHGATIHRLELVKRDA